MKSGISKAVFIVGTISALTLAGFTPVEATAAGVDGSLLRVAPEVGRDSARPEGLIPLRDGGYSIQTDSSDLRVPGAGGGTVTLRSAKSTIGVGLPGDARSRAAKDKLGISFSNGQRSSMTVVPKNDGSVQILTTIEDRSAPSVYSYPVTAPPGGRLTLADGGGAVLVDQAGKFIGGFAPPWAKDAAGRSISTRYEVKGSVLTQVVDHHASEVTYPVVADPWLGIDLYQQPWWYDVGGGWKVNVRPTAWGGRNTTVGIWWAHRDEVRSKMGGAAWRWTDTIQEQFYCHLAGYPLSLPEYNLESWRPAWNWAKMAPYNCNYPEGGWGSI